MPSFRLEANATTTVESVLLHWGVCNQLLLGTIPATFGFFVSSLLLNWQLRKRLCSIGAEQSGGLTGMHHSSTANRQVFQH
jgi:hypothetical protein